MARSEGNPGMKAPDHGPGMEILNRLHKAQLKFAPHRTGCIVLSTGYRAAHRSSLRVILHFQANGRTRSCINKPRKGTCRTKVADGISEVRRTTRNYRKAASRAGRRVVVEVMRSSHNIQGCDCTRRTCRSRFMSRRRQKGLIIWVDRRLVEVRRPNIATHPISAHQQITQHPLP